MKKIISILALVALFALSASGCSLFLKDRGSAKKKITLTYYRFGEDADAIAPLLQSYQTAHPGVSIQLVTKFSSFEQYEDLLINQIAEGGGPDLFSVPNTWIYKHQKIISPVPENLATVDQYRQTFVAVADRDLVRPDSDGSGKLRIFGIPLYVDTLGVFYNKFQYEDRIPSRGRPADLWKDFALDLASLAKAGGAAGFEVSGGALGRVDNVSSGLDTLYALILQHTGGIYASNGASTVLRTSFTDAVGFFTGFAKTGSNAFVWSKSMGRAHPEKELYDFASGRVSTIFGVSGTYAKLLKLLNSTATVSQGLKPLSVGTLGVAPLPQVYDPKASTNPRIAYAKYDFETVSRNTSRKQEAWDLLLFLSNKKNQEFFYSKTHRPTSRRDLLNQQSQDPLYGVFASQVGYASSLPLYHQPRVDAIMSVLVSDVADSSLALKDAISAAEAAINMLLPPGGFVGPGPHLATSK